MHVLIKNITMYIIHALTKFETNSKGAREDTGECVSTGIAFILQIAAEIPKDQSFCALKTFLGGFPSNKK